MSTSLRRTALAAAAVTTLLALSACGEDGTATDPVAGEGTGSPTTSAEPSPTEATSAPVEEPSDSDTVPVYYLGDTGSGPRLFREFRRVSGDPALGAVEMAASGVPSDPDYRSALPDGVTFTAVESGQDLIRIEVADGADQRPDTMSRAEAELALQSVVYTVQGALQARTPVSIVDGDGEPTTFLGIDTAGGVENADQLDVLSLVNITSPEEGAEVPGTFTASGVASSFEATVPWEVRDDSDAVVLDGFATAEGWMDALYPWETEVDVSGLAPGTYTFIAMTSDPSGGEGNPPMFDTKQITVG